MPISDAALPAAELKRSEACRLTPDRALSGIAEARSFLDDRGMLTRTTDCALPSLYQACHEEPYATDGVGFASWPRTKYTWFSELGEQPGVLLCKVHSGKNILFAPDVVVLLDPICRSELDRMHAGDPASARLLDYLASAGPAPLGQVHEELGLRPAELRAIRSPLERCGVVVSRQVVEAADDGAGHLHSSVLARFDQVVPEVLSSRDPHRAVAELLIAGLRAAVVAPERELARWFSWRWLTPRALVDGLVDDGRIVRIGNGAVVAQDEEG